MLDNHVGDLAQSKSTNESLWAKVSRELQLTADGAYIGVNKAAVHAVENPGQTVLTIGAAYAVGLGLAALSKGRITAPLANVAKLSFGAAFIKDIAMNGKEIAGAMADNWQSGDNYQKNRKIVSDSVGPLVVDTALMTVGGKLAHKTFAGAKPILDSVKNSGFPSLPGQPGLAFAGAPASGGRSFTRFTAERVNTPVKMESRFDSRAGVTGEGAALPVKPGSAEVIPISAGASEPKVHAVARTSPSYTDVSLAERTTAKGKSWQQIYRSSFPASESDSVRGIQGRVASGESMLHETRAAVTRPDGRKSTRTLAFSLIDPIGTVAVNGESRSTQLLSYLATREGYRSTGIGGQHLDAVLSEIRSAGATPKPLAVMFEIDHTGLRTLPPLETLQTSLARGEVPAGFARNPRIAVTPEEQLTNLSRLKFYLKHGAQVANVEYKMPNLEDGSLPPVPAHLMFFNFGERPMSERTLRSIVRQIYTNCYELEANDPLIRRVLRTVGRTALGDGISQQRSAAA